MLIYVTDMVGLSWEWFSKPAVLFLDGSSPISGTRKLLISEWRNSDQLSWILDCFLLGVWPISGAVNLRFWKGESLQESKNSQWGWNLQRKELKGWRLCFTPGREKVPGVQTSVGWGEEEWCAHKYAMEQLKLNVRRSLIKLIRVNINSTEIK